MANKKVKVIDSARSSSKKLKILMVATESSPYVSIGGIGSVTNHLSKSLSDLGHDVRLFIPKFAPIDREKYPLDMVVEGLKVPTDDESLPELICNVKKTKNESGIIVYFLENQEYFEKRANVYGYNDDPTRFILLSRGALEFIRAQEFIPDVIHCNDWHTGSLAYYLKTSYQKDPLLKSITTLFTIHNLSFQGVIDHRHVSELNYDDGKSSIGSIFSPRVNTLNFMRRGILFSDVVNTVSKNYAREILTAEYGEGLDKLLLELKDKLFGIINGIDYDDFNPSTDPLIVKNYDINSTINRLENKKALQKQFDLPIDPNIFLIGFVGRLDFQKGVDLMVDVLRKLLKDCDCQFVQVGGGDWTLAEMLQELKEEFPNKVGVHPYPNFTLPKLVFSGADCMLMPSRFEPCGIVQIESMRYGAVPIVRGVGGLADTVEDFDSISGRGNGFVFKSFDGYCLFGQIVRAMELFKHKKIWNKLQKNGMLSDYSWNFSAKEYERLYIKTRSLKHKKMLKNPSLSGLLG